MRLEELQRLHEFMRMRRKVLEDESCRSDSSHDEAPVDQVVSFMTHESVVESTPCRMGEVFILA